MGLYTSDAAVNQNPVLNKETDFFFVGHVELNGNRSIFPFHGAKEIPNPLVNAIKKDLGLK